MIQRATVFLLSLLLSLNVMAAPSVFGVTIGEMTESDFKQQFNTTHHGTSKFTNGNAYSISLNDIDFNGITTPPIVVFNTDKTVAAVMFGVRKSRYDDLKDILEEKYSKVSEEDPFVGDKSAQFKEGNVVIDAKAPHMDNMMTLKYATKTFNRQKRVSQMREQTQKRQNESSQL